MIRKEKLPEIVYTANELEELILVYTQELGRIYNSTENIRDLLMFTAMNRYYNLITNSALRQQIKQEAHMLYNHLCSEFPVLKCGFTGRWKSLISFINKVISYLDEGRPLDDLKDMVAYRVTVDSDILTEEQLVRSCYKVLNKVAMFYLKRGYQLCYVDPVSDVLSKDSPLRKELIIPSVNELLIPDEFKGGVKDYIRFPKTSGYQSLHIILVHPDKNMPPVEIQIRTLWMDKFAKEGYVEKFNNPQQFSNSGYLESYIEGFVEGYLDPEHIPNQLVVSERNGHDTYKEDKYSNPIEYEENRIKLIDQSGFKQPLILFTFPN